MILFIQLFLAHILGDFVLQTNAIVKSKQKSKLRSTAFYFHILLHGVLVMLLVWDLNFWLPALVIMGTHFLIDTLRIYLPWKKYNPALFLLDQLLHILVLVGVVIWWEKPDISVAILQSPLFLVYATGIMFVTLPSSVIIRTMVSHWYDAARTGSDDTLQNAGSYIGMLERLFILLFVLIGRWEGVGFLIAAKSIFRFADIKGQPNRKLTEYFLIGTLLSIGLAMLTGLAMNHLLNIFL